MDSLVARRPGLPDLLPDNIRLWLITVLISVTVTALVFVTLRLWSRRLDKQKLWWDDYLIIFSAVWNLMVVVVSFEMYRSGLGLHTDIIALDDYTNIARLLLVADVLYAWNLAWTKISLLLMYHRIFPVPFMKKAVWGVGGFVLAWAICATFLFIFVCVPVEKLWYPQLPGHCISRLGTWIANAASTSLTDLIILVLPIPQIWGLKLRTLEKIGVAFAYGVGLIVVFASAYRARLLFEYSEDDPTFTLAPTIGWTAIDISGGIISACLPTLLPILGKIGFGRFINNVQGSSTKGNFQSVAQVAPSNAESAAPPIKEKSQAREKRNLFYKLNATESEELVRRAAQFEFPENTFADPNTKRPSSRGSEWTITASSEDGNYEEENYDEVPLEGMRGQTDTERLVVKK